MKDTLKIFRHISCLHPHSRNNWHRWTIDTNGKTCATRQEHLFHREITISQIFCQRDCDRPKIKQVLWGSAHFSNCVITMPREFPLYLWLHTGWFELSWDKRASEPASERASEQASKQALKASKHWKQASIEGKQALKASKHWRQASIEGKQALKASKHWRQASIEGKQALKASCDLSGLLAHTERHRVRQARHRQEQRRCQRLVHHTKKGQITPTKGQISTKKGQMSTWKEPNQYQKRNKSRQVVINRDKHGLRMSITTTRQKGWRPFLPVIQ
jgi:hypothetical protein